MRIFGYLFLWLLCCLPLWAEQWYCEVGGERSTLTPMNSGVTFYCDTASPLLVYKEPDRKKFRPSPADFEAARVFVKIRYTDVEQPLKVLFFFKNKDGLWFQSVREFQLTPGIWHEWEVPLEYTGRHWRAVGHGATFSGLDRRDIFTLGLSVYGGEGGVGKIEIAEMRREGKIKTSSLKIEDWQQPDSGMVNRMAEGRFQLSREYFNPFDPEEVAVDFELCGPDGEITSRPAFFGRDYYRRRHRISEEVLPEGRGYWAFRFLPEKTGLYKIRLRIREKGKELLVSDWHRFEALPASAPGPVRVSLSRPEFFERTTGEFFFPVGLNIHTNLDRRSERVFGFGRLPDLGLSDYDRYLTRCSENGINLIEVWMAGWTMALEHSAAYPGFGGVGRYNLASAWKLDYLLAEAEKKGILLNLVIDNHGRITEGSDSEWSENPINSRSEYSMANGGFLEDPAEFFKSESAWRNNANRARYISARWGASPQIMAIEFWSEIDLTQAFEQRCEDGSLEKWIRNSISDYRKWMQLPFPMTIHICSDFQKMLRFGKLYEQTGATHWAGDAYRDPRVHFVDHLRAYREGMKSGARPQLITEYGGTAHGSAVANVIADIHAGLWGSLFARLSGTPMLWWHDFVDRNELYSHYAGFSAYLKNIDLRGGKPEYFSPEVSSPAGVHRCEALAVSVSHGIYGWIFFYDAMREYPELTDPTWKNVEGIKLTLPMVEQGNWTLRWFDTLTGNVIMQQSIEMKQRGVCSLTVPAFRLDLAFKLERAEQ